MTGFERLTDQEPVTDLHPAQSLEQLADETEVENVESRNNARIEDQDETDICKKASTAPNVESRVWIQDKVHYHDQ